MALAKAVVFVLLAGVLLVSARELSFPHPHLPNLPNLPDLPDPLKCAANVHERDCRGSCRWCTLTDKLFHKLPLSGLCLDKTGSEKLEDQGWFDCSNIATSPPAISCTKYKQEECKGASDCSWCDSKTKFLPSACFSESEVKGLPTALYSCDDPAPQPHSCVEHDTAESCELIAQSEGCSWCKSQVKMLKDVCVPEGVTKLLPSSVYDCSEISPSVTR